MVFRHAPIPRKGSGKQQQQQQRKLTEECSLRVVASGSSRGFSIEHQPFKKENKMIISRLYMLVNSNITNTLVVILDSNKIKCYIPRIQA